MADRCVAHLDMDAFYVSAELRRRPELRGLPVVVAGSGPRAVLTTASYEARAFGVHSAMPASRARALCPQAVFLTPDFPYYREASAAVMAIVRAHVEQVEVVGLDEVYLELSDLPAPHACMRRVRAEIVRATGLGCSVGIGPNKLVAKVASDAEKPGGFVVLTRERACRRFAQASPGLIPGIGPKTVERLRALDIATIAALASADGALLAASFGSRGGAHLQSLARFEHGGSVTQERKVISESRERTFDRDIDDAGQLESILSRLVSELSAALERQDRRGRTIAIKVRLDDFSTYTRARTLPEPVRSADRVLPVALDLLRRSPPARPVRLLGVRVAGLTDGVEPHDQLTLAFDGPAPAA